jgi:hypothetical protein
MQLSRRRSVHVTHVTQSIMMLTYSRASAESHVCHVKNCARSDSRKRARDLVRPRYGFSSHFAGGKTDEDYNPVARRVQNIVQIYNE